MSPLSWIWVVKCLGRAGKAGRSRQGRRSDASLLLQPWAKLSSIPRSQGKKNMVTFMSQKSPSPAVMCFSQDPEQSRNKKFWITGLCLYHYLPKQTIPSFSGTLTFVLTLFPSGRQWGPFSMWRYECLEAGGHHQLWSGLCREEQARGLQQNHLLPGLDPRADGGLGLPCLARICQSWAVFYGHWNWRGCLGIGAGAK